MRSDWFECASCEEEFKVLNTSIVQVEYCPFCGSNVESEEDPDEDEEED